MPSIKLGNLIEPTDERNINLKFGPNELKGISISKALMPTKAEVDNLDLRNYKIVRHNDFCYSLVTSRNGEKISVAFNDGNDCLVSSVNPTFRVKNEALLLPRFLMMFFNRAEFDRYARFNSWGSARETFSWDDLCDIEFELPSLDIQRKYVAIYESLLANLQAYKSRLEDLKRTCEAYIEDLRRKYTPVPIGPFIRELNERNEGRFNLFKGVDVSMNFIDAKRVAEDTYSGKVVHDGEFAFNKVMKADCTKLPIALRHGETCVISGSYSVFKIIDTNKLSNNYLMLWLSRTETQRYAGFVSYGTTRDIFDLANLSSIKIPVPELNVQKAISDVFSVYSERNKILLSLQKQVKNICPILIRGAIWDSEEER